MVVPFSIDEPTKASWYISVTTDSNGICTVIAILPPFAPTDVPLDTLRRGEQHGVIIAKWPNLSAKNTTDIPPKKAGLQAASEGG
jgi:hypothetical protein